MANHEVAILVLFHGIAGLVFLRLVAVGRHSVLVQAEADAAAKARDADRRRHLKHESQADEAPNTSDGESTNTG